MRARVGKEDEYFDKKVVRPPVGNDCLPPADLVAIGLMAKNLLVASSAAPRCSEAPDKKSQPRGSSSPRPSIVGDVAFQPVQHRSIHLFQSPAPATAVKGRAGIEPERLLRNQERERQVVDRRD